MWVTVGEGRPERIPINAPSIGPEELAAVQRVLSSGWIGTGPECDRFEQELADLLGGVEVVCTNSCTASIEIAVDYLGLPPGSRVGVPAWTHPATALPAALSGATVVLLDVDPDTLQLSAESLAGAIDEGLDLLIPVHFAGRPLDRSILDRARSAGVPIVEDAAHAFGASDADGPVAGRASIAAAFSFHATKNLTTGEGGALATTDPELAAFARAHRHHGLDEDAWSRQRSGRWSAGDILRPGRKSNLPDTLAAIGRVQLASFASRQDHRRDLTNRYRHHLASMDGAALVPASPGQGDANHLAVVVLDPGVDRDRVVEHLESAGIATGLHYTPLHELTWFREHAVIGPSGLSVCDDLARRALTLPLHSRLREADVDDVCEQFAMAIDVGAGA